MSDDVALSINGVNVSGWTSVRVTRGMERMPSDFDIAMTERFPGVDEITVNAATPCVLKIGDDTVITGYVDRVTPAIGPGEHALTINGRGKCEDVVDCMADVPQFFFPGGTWTADAVQKLAAPYGIKVKALSRGIQHLPEMINVGETAYTVMEKLCRLAGLLCYEDADGDIVIGPVSDTKAGGKLEQGVNIERASYAMDMSGRFNKYIVYPVGSLALQDASLQSMQEYEIDDIGVPSTRNRRIAFVALNNDPGFQVSNKHALWECNRRYARGNVVIVTVSTWRDANGKLYTPNTLIDVSIPKLKVPTDANFQWTISEVTYRRDSGGTACDLVLMPKSGFMPEPIIVQPLPVDAASALYGNGTPNIPGSNLNGN